MGIEKIPIEQFLELSGKFPVIDVRSPGEYHHAHIPGAFNLPLFTDEQRAVVGTTYKQKSREEAIKTGLDFFGPKMKIMVEEVEEIIGNRQQAISKATSNTDSLPGVNCLLLYCWRGGMRSAAVAWLLDLYGFKVFTLAGGYKKFRNHVLNLFHSPYRFNILGGYTGSGKTEILKALQEKGERVIDLEKIAHHKGSAFGHIGMLPQPTQEMFENILAGELYSKSFDKKISIHNNGNGAGLPIWLEDESQRIGLVNIPKALWLTMRKSPVYFLEIPFKKRLEHLVKEYGNLDREKMTAAIERISEKLGGLEAKNAINFLQKGEIPACFEILLKYYDKYYLKALHNREDINSLLFMIYCDSVTPENVPYLVSQLQYQSDMQQISYTSPAFAPVYVPPADRSLGRKS